MDSIREKLPGFRIVFRPHPRVVQGIRVQCRTQPIEGVEVWTDQDKSLEETIRGAAFAVTYSSNSAVEVRPEPPAHHRDGGDGNNEY